MHKLPPRSLGSSKLQVSCQGLGCMGMSEFYGETSEEESIATLNAAVNAGVNFFDTANVYGVSGENENLIGKFLKHHSREKLVIATKCGIVRDKDDATKRGVNNNPDYIISCCNASLKRLQTDYIDLYYLHRINEITPDGAPLEESMKAFAQLLQDGKICHVGISEASPNQIKRAHLALLQYTDGKHGLSAVQIEYSLMSRGIEVDGTLATCREFNIGIVAYSPLSRQLLTDNLKLANLAKDDFRRNLPRFQGENLTKNTEIITKIKEIAAKKGCSVSQLALAWVLAQGDDIIPIPGTKREKYLLSNVEASKIQLTENELEQINQVAPPYSATGERYAPSAMKAYGLKK
jgi:aryl-alcohol dehydrogenase-like predicted oxidoreductase